MINGRCARSTGRRQLTMLPAGGHPRQAPVRTLGTSAATNAGHVFDLVADALDRLGERGLFLVRSPNSFQEISRRVDQDFEGMLEWLTVSTSP